MLPVNYKLITEAGELEQAANEMRGEQAIGFDTETTGLDPHNAKLRLIQLATPRASFIIDCFRLSRDQLKPILEILAAPRPVKIAHNAKFDAKFLMRHCGARLGAVFDTYLASNLASAGDENDRHSLEAVVNRYLDMPLDKAAQTSDWSRELSEYQLEYAARDAQVLLPLREQLLEKLREMDLLLVADLEFDCVFSIAALELAGIYLDVERWRDLIGRIRVEYERVAEELHREIGAASPQLSLFGDVTGRINLDSPAQVKEALQRIGIAVEDTREWTLQKLAHRFPILDKLLEYRGFSKSLSSYGEGILDYINPATGRIHADFRQIGTPTGRITTSSPSLQQIPHTTEYRSCFRAPAGRQFIVADYCVAEGTRIATGRGLMSVESVMAGEQVFLEDGTTAEVTAVIDRGVLPVVTLRLKNGYSLTATAFHRVRVLDAKGDYVWRRIGEIEPTDFVVIQPGRGLHNELPKEVFSSPHKSHFNEREVKVPKSVDKRLATLLGYLTGDGTLQSGRVGWVVNIQDQDIADLLEQWAKESFGLPIHHRGSYRGVVEYAIYSTLLLSWLKEIGVSKNQLPGFLWRSSPEIVASYLRGIFESDGSVSDDATGKVSFGSSRERLAREVHQLLLALGIPATLRYQGNIGPDRRFSCWIVSVLASGVKRFYEQVGFISSRKQGKLTALVNRWTGKTVAGNIPNLKQKVSDLRLSGEPRRLLANTWCLGRPVSRALALNIEKNYPEIARQIGLEHITEYNQLFLPVASIEPAGNQHVYDLTVPGPTTYISNGFVSHNSQIEMRILADFARDEALLKAFDSGADLHRMTASQMFGVPLDQVTPRQRESAKGLNYGLVYGMGAEGLASRIESTVKEAEILIERYFAAYSGVERWLNEAAEKAVRDRRARAASGRLWIFRLDPHDRSQLGALKRVGKNAPIQGCLGPDVRIHTDRGSWKISDLAALDCTEFRVFDGETYVPFRAFPSGVKAAHQITSGDGWSMIASANHRFRVATPDGPVWKRTDQLAQDDLLMAVREPVPSGVDETPPYTYVKGHWRETYKSYHLPSKWGPMLAELVGALIGDGSYGAGSKHGRMYLAVGEADYDVRDWYLQAWKDLFGYQAAVREMPAFGNRHARCQVAVYSVEIRGFLEAQGLARTIGEDKIIPEPLFRACPEIRAGVLRGLFTTDGTVTPDCIPAFRTTSPFVARGTRQLLTSLGIASTLRSFKYSEKTAYRVSVNRVDARRFAEIVGFRATRKQNKLVNPAKPVTGIQDRAPAWMLREVGQAGLATSLSSNSERAHLHRMASGGGSIQALVKYRDRLTTKWQSPGLEQAELYRYVPVVSVIPLGTEIEMYDLEVFADSHSFVADGFVTHNSASDIFKRAMTLLDQALLSRDAQIVNSIHDEIVVECEESIADEVKQITIRKMIEGAKEFLTRVPVEVEAVISDAWLKK